ncbi:hypothetical protein DL762_010196 [Monosporascus cannonballus]|uniref:Transcription initiation factor IIF subunit beta n=1 Tax=Monosporascus cannonballus TaxID=155416 RepID=A0ABY0GRQ0_9PEZI|nr:hypothetical protein DL762_010196 [Monosporascus cannonballus]
MASTSQVKPESGIKNDPDDVKPSPAALSDDDIYEDAGDLEFYTDNPAPDNYAGNVYLTHVPKYLYDAWVHLDDDAEIRIGTIRQWNEVGPDGQPRQRIAMLLDHRQPEHQNVPKEYNLDVKDMQLINTFMFTEQDLPGYKNKSQGANRNIPPHLRRRQEQPSRDKNQQDANAGVKKRYQPYYRKAIPKKTVLAGKFAHELNCQPVMNAETRHILTTRASDAMKPKATTKMMAAARGMPSGIIQAGSFAPDKFSTLVRPLADAKKAAKKKQEERAARLSQSELRDRIFQCYDRFNYWSMKAFKQTLNQPEAWLRENLEELAVLHKTGRFANHWELKPEYKRGNLQGVESAAPDLGPEGDESDFDADDDNVEMEDKPVSQSSPPPFSQLSPIAISHNHSPPPPAMSIFLDFDGTITAQDTIGELAGFALRLQRSDAGRDLSCEWDAVVQAYIDDYRAGADGHHTPAAARLEPAQEVEFLRALKHLETCSLDRVRRCGLFRGIGGGAFREAGRALVANGTINLRPGFREFVDVRAREGWRVWVVSVNWSASFIEGACGHPGITVVANDVREDGSVAGPAILNRGGGEPRTLTNSQDKLDVMEAVLRQESLADKLSVYVGDSNTDLECLLAAHRGIVIADSPDTTLLETLRRIGKKAPHVREADGISTFLLEKSNYLVIMSRSGKPAKGKEKVNDKSRDPYIEEPIEPSDNPAYYGRADKSSSKPANRSPHQKTPSKHRRKASAQPDVSGPSPAAPIVPPPAPDPPLPALYALSVTPDTSLAASYTPPQALVIPPVVPDPPPSLESAWRAHQLPHDMFWKQIKERYGFESWYEPEQVDYYVDYNKRKRKISQPLPGKESNFVAYFLQLDFPITRRRRLSSILRDLDDLYTQYSKKNKLDLGYKPGYEIRLMDPEDPEGEVLETMWDPPTAVWDLNDGRYRVNKMKGQYDHTTEGR